MMAGTVRARNAKLGRKLEVGTICNFFTTQSGTGNEFRIAITRRQIILLVYTGFVQPYFLD